MLLVGWALAVVGFVIVVAGPDVPGGLCAAVGGVILVARALIALRRATEIQVARSILLLLAGGWVAAIGLIVAASA